MRRSEEVFYRKLIDTNPNMQVVKLFCYASVVVALIALLNVVGVFHLNPGYPTYAYFALGGAFLALLLPRLLFTETTGLKNPKMKYILMGLSLVVTLILVTLLNHHASLVLVFPIVVAMQYPSKPVMRMGIVGSVALGLICPALSYVLNTYSDRFVNFLIHTTYRVPAELAAEAFSWEILGRIVLYIALPQAMILVVLSFLLAESVKKSIRTVENQMEVLHLSTSDPLTGLLNRRSFEESVEALQTNPPMSVMICYVDVNGLHELNYAKGHEAGDQLLTATAQELLKRFGENSVFRVGGDEFMLLVRNPDRRQVSLDLEDASAELEKNDYHIAYGLVLSKYPCDINHMLQLAESRMNMNKELFYKARGFDRRGQKVETYNNPHNPIERDGEEPVPVDEETES